MTYWASVSNRGRCSEVVRPTRRQTRAHRLDKRCFNRARFTVKARTLGIVTEVCGVHANLYRGDPEIVIEEIKETVVT